MSKKDEKMPWEELYDGIKELLQYFDDFSSVDELWKLCAKAGAEVTHCQNKVEQGELEDTAKLLNHFVCILEVLEKVQKTMK